MPNIEEALRLAASGLSIIPTTLQDKKPCENLPFPMPWKRWQSEIASEDQIRRWWTQDLSLAIIAGSVSGNLEMIDFDYRAKFAKKWREIVVQNAPGLFEKLVIQRTQNSGRHVIYRCSSPVGRNVELTHHVCEVPDGMEHRYNDLGKPLKPTQRNGIWYIRPCMIETRGDGGYFLAAPSQGYEVLQGSLTDIPVITVAERDILLRAAMALDEQLPDEVKKVRMPEPVIDWNTQNHDKKKRDWKGKSTADDFNERFEIRDLIESHGWQFDHSARGNDYFTRPGKAAGVSASFNGEVFYCFTSNDPQFNQSQGYSKFQVYAILEHAGDLSAAAKRLYAEGFGDRQVSDEIKTSQGSGSGKTELRPDEGKGKHCEPDENDEPLVVRPVFVAPEWAEIQAAIDGTPLGTYCHEADGIGINVPKGFLLVDAIMLACLVCAKVGVKIVRIAGAPQPTNAYGLKLGKSGQSKGLTSDLLLEMADKFGISRLHGKSEAAIIKNVLAEGAVGGTVGLHYVSEISKLLDPRNAVSNSMCQFWLEAFDLGYADWSTKGSNSHLDEFNPSCLFLGQPSVIEEVVGAKTSVKTGFVPRCLMVYDESARQEGSPRGVDKNRILAAYQEYERSLGSKLIRVPYHEPRGRMADYKPWMTEFEESIWKRLRYHYAPRIAILMHPQAIGDGELTPSMLDRTGPVLDYFFAQAQRIVGLLHDDRGEMFRCKFERYVHQHPGCTRRDILMNLHMSLKDYNEISNTVKARGGAHERPMSTTARQRLGWFPGPKAGTITANCCNSVASVLQQINPPIPKDLDHCCNTSIGTSIYNKGPLYPIATAVENLKPLNSIEDIRCNIVATALQQPPKLSNDDIDWLEVAINENRGRANADPEWEHFELGFRSWILKGA